MQKIKLLLVSIMSVFAMGVSIVPAAPVMAQSDTGNALCNGATGSLNPTDDCDTASGSTTLTTTIKRVIQLFQLIVGLISVFMIIFGGLKYITSGGNDGAVKGAKNTILYAVIGLVIVAIAQAVVQFVLNRFDTTV